MLLASMTQFDTYNNYTNSLLLKNFLHTDSLSQEINIFKNLRLSSIPKF